MIDKIFARFTEPTYVLLRVFSGLLFACHGAQKLFGVLGGSQAEDALRLVAGIVEFFGGIGIALGLLTNLLAFLSAGQMAVAYLIAHAPRGFWPIENRGELALLYMFIFLLLAARGSGRWSIDGILFAPGEPSAVTQESSS